MIIVNASARWNRALYQFEKTKDYEAFRDALIPLSQQKLHFVIRMKAEVNLTWIYSYLGQSQEAKEVCKKIIAKNKNLIGTSMAYATLIQELILEGDLEEAKKQWKDAMEMSRACRDWRMFPVPRKNGRRKVKPVPSGIGTCVISCSRMPVSIVKNWRPFRTFTVVMPNI